MALDSFKINLLIWERIIHQEVSRSRLNCDIEIEDERREQDATIKNGLLYKGNNRISSEDRES